jgi:hypothetical protein
MLFATCLTAAALPAKARACCSAMQHHCSGASMESSCCAVSSATTQAVVPARAPDSQRTIDVIAVTLRYAAEEGSIRPRSGCGGHVSPSPPGVPTYLFVSSFRI